MIGAGLGFGGGIALYYRSCLSQALLALQNYPRLLLLHLHANHPTYKWDMGRATALAEGRDGGWVRKSMLVIAWQSAGPALEVSGSCRTAPLLKLRWSNSLICRQEIHIREENAIVADINDEKSQI